MKQPTMNARPYAVICAPWEGDCYFVSYHTTYSASKKAVDRCRKRFWAHNPDGFGYGWQAVKRSSKDTLASLYARAKEEEYTEEYY